MYDFIIYALGGFLYYVGWVRPRTSNRALAALMVLFWPVGAVLELAAIAWLTIRKETTSC